MDETGIERPYSDAIVGYLDAASWIGPLDMPMVVHIKALARTLDTQLVRDGEVQAAAASSFTRTMVLLDKNRPAPPPDPMAGQLPGQASIDDELLSPS